MPHVPLPGFHGRHPFGAVYVIEQDQPWSETERDVQLMHDMGYDLVTLWPAANSWLATRPDEFVTTDTRRVLDLLHQHGMQAVVQLIGQNPAQEYLPDCLLTREMQVQQASAGNRTPSWANCSWANPLHPQVDTLVQRYLADVIGQLKDHPAIWSWDLFNEAHLHTDDPWSLAEYRRWLARRYASIEDLNHRWHRRYASFEQVDPGNRMVPYSIWSSILPQVDYEHFRAELTTEVCRRWIRYARAVDPLRPLTIDCLGFNLAGGDVTWRNTDEFGVATTPDVFGGTYYPKSWGRDVGQAPWVFTCALAISAAAARTAGKPYVVNELQTHTQGALTSGSEVAPGELTCWTWTTMARGSQAMQLWRQRPFLHGYQSSGRGLTRLDGIPGPRAAAVAELVATLRRHETLIAAARPVAPAAVLLVSYRNRLIFDAYRHFEDSRHAAAITGWWRLLEAVGLPAEIGDIDRRDAAADQAPILVLPSLIALSDEHCAWLAARVAAGALVIADARLAAVDHDGVVRAEASPGAVLSPVFGVVERDVAGAIQATLAGSPIHGGFLSQQLEVLPGAEVLVRTDAGQPLVVANRHGAGATLYIAAHAGEIWREQLTPAITAWFAARLAAAAPDAPRISGDGLHHSAVHGVGATRLAYLVSWAAEPQVMTIANLPVTWVQVLDGARLPVVDGVVQLTVAPRACALVRWELP